MKKTILVAEDRDASRELISTVLTAAGYRVIEARDGEEAVALAQKDLADLVILDLYMPKLDGFGALERLRQDPLYATVPIIALTASAMARDREHALRLGFSEYFSKPINLSTLRREVGRLLGTRYESCGAS